MLALFAQTAHAMGSPGGGAGASDPQQQLFGLLPLVAMFVIFYFLLIRPQQKRAKEQKAMLEALKRGDEVVTASGILGRVANIADDVVTLEVEQNVKIRFQKSAIASVKKVGT
ncbi:MAG: preprotein translocase subunit YajC [Deltaproteobacteria bacterium]|nr:preprotein translocase subunit YajC [Deltaproteobacteria bacterium]